MSIEAREFETDELWDISYDDFEGAHIVRKDAHREGWYEFYQVTFVYDGVQYEFTYKEHTSPNVCDREIVKDAKPTEEQPVHIDPDAEAHYIWEGLMRQGKGHISKDEIKAIVELQFEYLDKIGVIQ